MPGFEVHGTDAFRKAAADLKRAGRGDLTRKMTADMKRAADPAVREMKALVQGLSTKSTRSGRKSSNYSRKVARAKDGPQGNRRIRTTSSARQARVEHALRNRKKLTDRSRAKAYGRAGLRATVARATGTTASTSPTRAAVRIRAAQARMPPDQRALPRLMDRGRWRKPTFGRGRWTSQAVTPAGWFSEPRKRHGPRIRTAAHAVVIRVLHDLGNG
ncbi:hypothetical protein [Saccharothrix texasensis]|uniref:Uncharacterized protein n=1 Tax=Saccharothrix texasensis TaxID=103734 RepID=A0A3N1H1D2_9PSEU|nr:hypothetical protein [Saccharothrix texasensis]ROP36288.1 hypothetical protein EDD40_1553 [Saccharothrix texasensis]